MEIIIEIVVGAFTVIGGLSSLFGFSKWLVGRLRSRKSPPERTIAAINYFNSFIERTVVVPYIVRETVQTVKEKVVPVFIPHNPSTPQRPSVPEWLEPTPPRTPEIRPERPVRPGRPGPSWVPSWMPHREPRTPEHVHRPLDGGFPVDFSRGDGSDFGGTPPDFDPRTSFGDPFDGRPQSDTHVGGRDFGGLRAGNRHFFDD